MDTTEISLAYGPVPSRRLGYSIGINNIPPKHCTYSCIYCQLGSAGKYSMDRRTFHDPNRILEDVRNIVSESENGDGKIDYLTFVPDGEPTLDINLGKEIDMVKDLGYPVAVITNSSLLSSTDVREDLQGADLISVKIDSVDEDIWRRLNRPMGGLKLSNIMEGIRNLTDEIDGILITETMMVKGINDDDGILSCTADFIRDIGPHFSYITVPIRPPSEEWVETPADDRILSGLELFSSRKLRVDCLNEGEYGNFSFTGDIRSDILSITSVHPMRRDSVMGLLERAGSRWKLIEEMLADDDLYMTEYNGIEFYRRKFKTGNFRKPHQ